MVNVLWRETSECSELHNVRSETWTDDFYFILLTAGMVMNLTMPMNSYYVFSKIVLLFNYKLVKHCVCI